MASQTFIYREHNGKLYPTLPVTVKRLNKSVSFDALVDSGSTVTLLRHEIANELGIPLERSPKKPITGLSSVSEGHEYSLEMRLFDDFFQCKVAFVRPFSFPLNIIGREDFFDRHEILFRERKRELIVTEV
ncbi:retroviral-like aspartic protease [Candidatus Micrarchaeota archaeon]|nr:retroviral-like aspartic protease [Candidatus Micrarchaeota archaeon]